MEVNEEKRNKFMEYAGKRVNNVMHDIQILEPMARSNAYDFTKEDVEEMFNAMQETLNDAKAEFNKRFEEKSRTEKKVFSFGTNKVSSSITSNGVSSEGTSKVPNAEATSASDLVEDANSEQSDDVAVF